MKKLTKKLSLHKETLVNLDASRLSRAAQGGTAETMFCGPTQVTCNCPGTDDCGFTGGLYCTLGGCTGAEN